MNRDETVALFLQGKDAWNAWAGHPDAKELKLAVSRGEAICQ